MSKKREKSETRPKSRAGAEVAEQHSATRTSQPVENRGGNEIGQPVFRISIVRLLVLAAVFATLVVLGGWISGGKSVAEKATIRLVQPVGVFWLLFSGWCIEVTYVRIADQISRRRRSLDAPRQTAQLAFPIIAWLLFMVFTTSPLCSWCVAYLESGVESYRPESGESLAAVVVLGGGTHQGPWRAEVSGAGDRVVYAAELYHRGHTKRLITTGEATPGVSRDSTSPSEHTTEIWTHLNIPESAIGTLKGQNTYQELQDLKQHWSEFDGGRVGLLTSAMHLPRALRLAKAQGLEVLPIAADHASSVGPFTYLDFIPSAGPLNQFSACQHEFMAWIVKR